MLKSELYVDSSQYSFYSYFMRWLSVVVIIAIALSVVVPPALTITLAQGGQPAAIGVLDVCHSATPALSSNGEMPCMNECPCKQGPVPVIVYAEKIDPILTHFLLSSQNERPPKA